MAKTVRQSVLASIGAASLVLGLTFVAALALAEDLEEQRFLRGEPASANPQEHRHE